MKTTLIKYKINSYQIQIHVHVILEEGQRIGVQMYKYTVHNFPFFNVDWENIVMVIAISSWFRSFSCKLSYSEFWNNNSIFVNLLPYTCTSAGIFAICYTLVNNNFFLPMYCKIKHEINVYYYGFRNNWLLTKNVYGGFQFDQSWLQTQGVLEFSTQGQ